MRPRLCLFTASPKPSGIGEHMVALASELRVRFRISFACIPDRAGAELLARASALGIEILPLDGRGFRYDPEIVRLKEWLRDQRVDIFHLHAGVGWEGHTATFAAREAGVPVVVRTEHLPHVITDLEERASHAHLLEEVDRLICVSEEARSSFLAAGLPAEKVVAVRNGIVPRRPRAPRIEMRRSLEIPADTPVVLTVARFTAQKGHRVLLEAIPAVLAHQPDTRFLWVGDGPEREALYESVLARGLAAHVRLLGQRHDVRALMGAVDLFVLPSLFEGLPLVVLEAMAAGLPVIGTRVCGTSEAIEDGVTGRLVETEDAAGLAAAVIEALHQPERAARWAAAARQRVWRDFSAAPELVVKPTPCERAEGALLSW
jgi:glycosyltransferase involved in cell wall biosynthesis